MDLINSNDYYERLKNEYSNITNTELWKYLAENTEGQKYARGISKVCFDACEATALITETLPNFTKHDSSHSASVCNWMVKLIGNNISILSYEEVALLITIACCHDVGMKLSKSNKEALMKELKDNRFGSDLEEYFENNQEMYERYKSRDINADNTELFEEIIRSFVRKRHHLRVEEEMGEESFDGLIGLRKKDIFLLCKSHGENLGSYEKFEEPTNARLYLCAILLRLADILNFDCSRTSEIKFINSGLNNPKSNEEIISSKEHILNRICSWKINNVSNSVVCTGKCDDNQIMHDIMRYIEWVRYEVEQSNKLLNMIMTNDNPLIINNVKQDLTGDFESGDFKISFNAKNIIELLGSENIYGEKQAFLSELIQNSTDAIYVRANIDKDFLIEQGKIDIYLWEKEDYVFVRIDDNGIGMDKNVIKNYFLTVGESYYKSSDFNKVLREGKNKFTPINGFGIGILSCFMNDPDVYMEVETRGLTADKETYRMNITSLEGYYSLYKLERNKNTYSLLKPDNIEILDGYNREIGTSVCLKYKSNSNKNAESLFRYLKDNVIFPTLDINIYNIQTNGETSKYSPVKKEELLSIFEEYMDGRRYKNYNDIINFYYLDKLENTMFDKEDIDKKSLLGIKGIFIQLNTHFRYTISSSESLKQFFENGIQRSTSKIEEQLNSILHQILNNSNKYPECFLVYNGNAIKICEYYDGFGIYFVEGDWYKNTNLSKTEILGKEKEIDYLIQNYKQLNNDRIVEPSIPLSESIIEAIEQSFINPKIVAIDDLIKMGNLTKLRFSASNFYIFSCLYDLHTSKIEDVYFNPTKRLSKEEIRNRIFLSYYLKPFVLFDDIDCRIIYKDGMLNRNNPFIGWIFKNFNRLESDGSLQKVISSLERLVDIDYKNLDNQWPKKYKFTVQYEWLEEMEEIMPEIIEDDILEYMESLKK